jgi:hypothetical protein
MAGLSLEQGFAGQGSYEDDLDRPVDDLEE